MSKNIRRSAVKSYTTVFVFLLCFAFYAACYAQTK